MKNTLLAASVALFLASCTNDDAVTSTRDITLHVDNISLDYDTRASMADASLTDLWIFEGDELLAHKVSTDADFSTPTISLSYGDHGLTFIASSSDGQAYSNGRWSTIHCVQDFANTKTVSVDGSSVDVQNVSLSRRSSRVKFLTTDKVPSNVIKCHLSVNNHKSLDADLKGCSAYTHEATVDISSKQGSTYSVFVNVLTESLTDEEDTDVMIEFLGAGDAVLYHYERTIKLKPNRCVSLTGSYFSGSSNAITIASTAWDDVSQSLFE